MRDRLIELLKKADKYASGVCTDYDEAQAVCAEYLISEGVIVPSVATAVDFVEVVRCKDCKWYVVHGLQCHRPYCNGYMGMNDFCSCGERREK